ncbi:dipeptidase 1-like isoform X1 [Bombus vosnesenskii]|uniref:Dipeptidase n=2 Tax=Pyrobombus TaxID=144703 RepID=A0A6J3LI44_9HYME|nr:dipeptidase 1-like isoform X1 [Bombus vancouverensis nearcticus]XP_033308599.1 dipeptidase 1-like isoform X1 [Bombus bifarius]XP_033364351.1 dipeptidase 1-like isoform X1 [Bombus vosnesenskii]XP_043586834.1 dipeptidase 1-like isoform X1 [Bombus pyrosoma]XP_050487916.1 dipeptidase 1-like isoform X1 [Bombus huntii]XP_060832186.1 dipeptidase 1-like isoform X1 [Bombus pascuorum]
MRCGGQSGVWTASVIILSIGSWVGKVGPRPADGETAHLTSPKERLETVRQVLSEVPLIDGHNDLPWNIRNFVHNQLAEFDFDKDLRQVAPWSKSAWSQTDLVRLRQGMVGGQFWAAYVPCESQHLNAVQLTLEQVDLIKRLIEKYSQHMQFAASSTEILDAHERGRIASLIGVEGGHSLGSSLAVLRTLYQLGVRYLTLTHTCNTPWAKSSSVEDEEEDGGGLTAFGKTVVQEMNRLGMLIDLSHTARATMRDALRASKAPVIFSHSSAFAICNSSRNVPDDILRQLAANGGLVMVTFYNYFVKCGSQATVSDVAEHIYYIKNLIGVDHIGVGGDFDGINKTPRGLEDVSKYPELFAELLRSGNWNVYDLKKVAGLNLLRVLQKVEKVRDDMRTAGMTPSEEYLQDSPDTTGSCALDINSVQTVMEI